MADFQFGNQHAHLQAPVTHMHIADGLIAGIGEDAAQ